LVIFLTFCDYLLLFATSFVFCNILFFLIFVISLIFCNYLKVLATQISFGPSFVIGAKENLGPFPLLRSKVLAPNLCHIDRHVGLKKFGLGPNVKPLGPI
jgi:hypothetical protein